MYGNIIIYIMEKRCEIILQNYLKTHEYIYIILIMNMIVIKYIIKNTKLFVIYLIKVIFYIIIMT